MTIDLTIIDWDSTAKLATFIIAFLALILSVYNTWKQRDRLLASMSIKYLRTEGTLHLFKVIVTNTGNTHFNIREAYHSAKSMEDGHFTKRLFEVIYEPEKQDRISSLEPGGICIFEGSCAGSIFLDRTLTIKLHNNRTISTSFRLNDQFYYNWTAFLLTLFKNSLPEYRVSFEEIFFDLLPTRYFLFYLKESNMFVESIAGRNPVVNQRVLYTEIIHDYELDGNPLIHTEEDKKRNSKVFQLLHILAQKFPDIFEIHLEKGSDIQPHEDGRIGLIFQYTLEACDSYTSESGGSEIFKKYNFEPGNILSP